MTRSLQDANPELPEPTLVGRRVGKYEVLGVVGRGGMGTVYEALNTTIQKHVAMKCIDASLASNPDAVARFQREALAASAVDSPHIVQIFDAGATREGAPYIVMELLRGRDLGSWLGSLGRLSPEQALPIVSQLLRGLHHAHAAGIVHRDLKPDNVFLAEREDEPAMVKILDFGVSKIANNPRVSLKTLTREGTIVGTPYYMSPEQAQGYPDVDGRTDLYSVGAILYECFAGRPPHVGEVYEQVIVSICMRDAEDVRTFAPDLSEPLALAIGRALAREREDRFGSAREMLDALLGAGPPALRVQASTTPSGVLRIDLGHRFPARTTPLGSPAAVLAGAAPRSDEDGVAKGDAATRGAAPEGAGASALVAPAPHEGSPLAAPSGGASETDSPPRGAAHDSALPETARHGSGPPQARSAHRDARPGHSTLRSAEDGRDPTRAAQAAEAPPIPAVFAATMRADSGVIRVGPATPTGEDESPPTRRLVALALSGIVLLGALALIAVATLGDDAGNDTSQATGSASNASDAAHASSGPATAPDRPVEPAEPSGSPPKEPASPASRGSTTARADRDPGPASPPGETGRSAHPVTAAATTKGPRPSPTPTASPPAPKATSTGLSIQTE